MGFISFRTYILVGIILGGIVLLAGMAFGEDIYSWAVRQDRNAFRADLEPLGTLVMEPIKFAFNPDQLPFGAILVGLAWPVALLWPLLILIHLLVVEGVGVVETSDLDPSSMLPLFWV